MSQTTLAPLLKEALEVHRSGSPTKAIPIYERALRGAPDDPDALSFYGLALVEAGRPSEAERPLKRAIELQPSRPIHHAHLADLLFKIGDADGAIEVLRRTTSAHPTFADGFIRLGNTYIARQDLNAAAEAFDRALQLRPNDRGTALILARALAASENFGGAYYVLDHMEQVHPNDVEAISLRLEIARTRRDFPALEALSQRLTQLSPNDPAGWRDLAAAYFESGRYEEALAAFERVLTLEPRTADNLSQIASIAINTLDFDRAAAALAEAEATAPENARMLSTKALLLTYQGRGEAAEAYCRRCFAADPNFYGVFPQLSLLRKGWLSEDEARHIKGFSDRSDVAPGARAIAAYVIAHDRDARGDIDAAFAEYSRANALAAERNQNDQLRYDFAGHAAWTDAIISVFGARTAAAEESHHEGPQPIFIVGLPRCGSTLVESVIAAHSAVDAGGEMPMMTNIFNKWFRDNYQSGEVNLLKVEKEQLANAYMRGVPPRFAKGRFTDKNLLNLEAAGLIAGVFPKATIINVRRNPIENGLSIWRQDMLKFWTWTTNFEDIARRYSLYARLIDHFERTLPAFHTVQYEDFVTGFPDEAKKLIGLCGLEWEDACLNFQEARAVAPTISAVQVREEVSLKGDRARLYGERLDPLRRALEAAGVDLATGALKK